jgi:uncharacterized protein (DUF1015 family)
MPCVMGMPVASGNKLPQENLVSLDHCLIRPFAGLRPRRADAAAVAAPPYDVLSSTEARQAVIGKPLSFLHVSRAEIDLPPEVDHYSPEVYARSAENFQRMIDDGVLCRDPRTCYYAYRLIMGEHVQTGLVATASVAAYDSHRIRRHEFTRPDKEDDRVRQIEALNAQTGPVLLAHPDSVKAEQLLALATDSPPVADLTADDGIRHTLWAIDDLASIARIGAVFGAMPNLYIADGHHRSAAAARVAAIRRHQNHASDSAEFFLSVIFPASQMLIMDYNRVVRDLNGLTEEAFLVAVASATLSARPERRSSPSVSGVCGMYLGGRWYRLEIRPGLIPVSDPVRQLDVSVLAEQILGSLARDHRSAPRHAHRLCRRHAWPVRTRTASEQRRNGRRLCHVSDADGRSDGRCRRGQVMPPKSTWFEPKLADGLVSLLLDPD